MKISILASGSTGNATYIETPKSKVLIDAGLSGKKIEELMNSIGRTLICKVKCQYCEIRNLQEYCFACVTLNSLRLGFKRFWRCMKQRVRNHSFNLVKI